MRAVFDALACGVAAGVALGAAQTFRSEVVAVRVDVSVTRGSVPVAGLGAEHFHVLDNAVPQQVDRVLADSVPLAAFLVLDTSGSLAGPKIASLRDAAHAFLKGLRTADRAAILTFSQQLTLQPELTSDVASLDAAIDRVTATGATALFDAVYATMKIRGRSDDRSVAVVFSDGLDTLSWLTESDVIDTATRSDVIVYGVGLAPGLRPGTIDWTDSTAQYRFLRRLADSTGGRMWSARPGSDLTNAFLRALEEIRARYTLVYSPRGVPPDGWHTLEVKLKGARGDVRARPGYWGRSPLKSDPGRTP